VMAYADNVYLTGPCDRAWVISRKIRVLLQDIYLFDDVQILRTAESESTGHAEHDAKMRKAWGCRLHALHAISTGILKMCLHAHTVRDRMVPQSLSNNESRG
jgi:hypothetical protein